MPDCKTCKEHRQNVEPVPYIVHESAMARQERTIKRLWILLIIIFSAFVISNGVWSWYENQWETVETTVTQENDDGYNNYIGEDGAIYNGEANCYYQEPQT